MPPTPAKVGRKDVFHFIFFSAYCICKIKKGFVRRIRRRASCFILFWSAVVVLQASCPGLRLHFFLLKKKEKEKRNYRYVIATGVLFLSVIFLFGSVTDWEFDSGKARLPEFFFDSKSGYIS